ncbi:MAG: hypothetical protein QOJ62_3069 [Actinomycetota bacterium]|nr:hypothetical protein [Actinomycetota bacterium]
MSLLTDLMNHAVDEGYVDAAKRKAATARAAASAPQTSTTDGAGSALQSTIARRPAKSVGLVAIVLALAGTLFATSAVTTHRNSAATNRDRKQLIQQVQLQTTEGARLQQQVDALRGQVAAARGSALSTSGQGAALEAQIAQLQAIDGGTVVEGPGVKVVLDSSKPTGNASLDNLGLILDNDLQRVVNGLFTSGAEAVAINGQRITTQTAIRQAGGAILVDYRPLSPPYTVDAIGGPELTTTFEAGQIGQLYENWRQTYGIQFVVQSSPRLTLPSAANQVVHYAKPLDAP